MNMYKLDVYQQLIAMKKLAGTIPFIYTVDFNTNLVIAVCKVKPELRYILNADGTDMVRTDRKIGIEVLDMVTVYDKVK